MTSGCQRHQLGRVFAHFVGVDCGPARFDPHVAADDPAQLREPLQERADARLLFRIVCGGGQEYADAPHPLALLRACRERPRGCRAAEQRDELAPLHVWMAPAWQEITSRAAQKSLAVMCPACSRSPDGLLALMGSANRGLIIRAGSMSR